MKLNFPSLKRNEEFPYNLLFSLFSYSYFVMRWFCSNILHNWYSMSSFYAYMRYERFHHSLQSTNFGCYCIINFVFYDRCSILCPFYRTLSHLSVEFMIRPHIFNDGNNGRWTGYSFEYHCQLYFIDNNKKGYSTRMHIQHPFLLLP